MATERNEKLRQRAYQIWENEGRPEGKEAEHWDRAEREIAQEEQHAEPAAASSARSRKKTAPADTVGVVADVPVAKKRPSARSTPAAAQPKAAKDAPGKAKKKD